MTRNPRYKILFGPVRISNDYRPVSRQLMVNFFRQLNGVDDRTRLVKSRSPLRTRPFER